LKAEAKLGIIDEEFLDIRTVEIVLFAADAAKTCASQRLSAGDDPHGCSAAVDYALAKVNAVRSELKLQRRKRHILQTRNEKDAKAYLEHMNESKHALLDYIKRSANSEHPDLPTALKEDTETKRRELGRPLSRPTLSPKRRDLKLSLFETSIQKRKKNQKREQTFEEAKRAEASSFSTSSNGRSTSLSQLQPTYYVRKRKELGLDVKKNRAPPRRSVLKLTPALSALLNESRLPRRQTVLPSTDKTDTNTFSTSMGTSAGQGRNKGNGITSDTGGNNNETKREWETRMERDNHEHYDIDYYDTTSGLHGVKDDEQEFVQQSQEEGSLLRPLPPPPPIAPPAPPSVPPPPQPPFRDDGDQWKSVEISTTSTNSTNSSSTSPPATTIPPASPYTVSPEALHTIPPATTATTATATASVSSPVPTSAAPMNSAAAHPTDGTGISVDDIRAMIASKGSPTKRSSSSPTADRPAFRYRAIKHRRMSDGLFAYQSPLNITPAERRNQAEKNLESIKKTTRARILNTIADAIHHRRSLFGSTISNVRRAFAAFDRNNSGVISVDEFRSGSRRLGLGLSEIQMAAVFDVLQKRGKDGENGISYNDFTQALQYRRDSIIS
jgi:hypothetical protein